MCDQKTTLELVFELALVIWSCISSHLRGRPSIRQVPGASHPPPSHPPAAVFMDDWGRPLRRAASKPSSPPKDPACSLQSTASAPTSAFAQRPRRTAATKTNARTVAARSPSPSSCADNDSDSLSSSSAAATPATTSIATFRSRLHRARAILPAPVTRDQSLDTATTFEGAHTPSHGSPSLAAASVALAIASNQPTSREQLESLTDVELRQICRSHDVEPHGSKRQLLPRLLCFLAKRSLACGHPHQLNLLSAADLKAFCQTQGVPYTNNREELIAQLLQLTERQVQHSSDCGAAAFASGVVELTAAAQHPPADHASAPSHSSAIDTPALLSPSTPCSLSGSAAATSSPAPHAAPRISSARRRLSSPQPSATAIDAACNQTVVQPCSTITASNVVVGQPQLPSAAPAATAAASALKVPSLLSLSDDSGFNQLNVKTLRLKVKKVYPHANVVHMNRHALVQCLTMHSIETSCGIQLTSGGAAVDNDCADR